MSVNTERLRDPRQRAERATRILDTAADLLLRHGYRRVTMDDVAAGAGIGKGTVYLHWKTREQLFGAVFEREAHYAVEELRLALRQDSATCLLHDFARVYFRAITNRPLLHGFLLADPDLLGKLTSSPDTARDDRHGAVARDYLALLAGQGLLRDDMTVDEIAYAYQATFEGFLRAESATDDPDRRADLLARTVQRAFESGQAASDDTLHDLAAATDDLLGELIDADRAESSPPSHGSEA